MVEKRCIGHFSLNYEGLFNSKEFFAVLDNWYHDMGYDKNDIKIEEKVTEKGKFIYHEIMPYKKMSDYVKYAIYIEITILDLVNVDVEIDKKKVRVNKGKVRIEFYPYIITDYENRWEKQPTIFFLRAVFDKFLFKREIDKMGSQLIGETKKLYNTLRSYLNINQFKV